MISPRVGSCCADAGGGGAVDDAELLAVDFFAVDFVAAFFAVDLVAADFLAVLFLGGFGSMV